MRTNFSTREPSPSEAANGSGFRGESLVYVRILVESRCGGWIEGQEGELAPKLPVWRASVNAFLFLRFSWIQIDVAFLGEFTLFPAHAAWLG